MEPSRMTHDSQNKLEWDKSNFGFCAIAMAVLESSNVFKPGSIL